MNSSHPWRVTGNLWLRLKEQRKESYRRRARKYAADNAEFYNAIARAKRSAHQPSTLNAQP